MEDREIEVLFRLLRLYDQLGRRAEGLVRTIQRVMKERYGDARTIAMVRLEGGQLAMDQRACRSAAGATREGYCYQHVQAITVAIDQYA